PRRHGEEGGRDAAEQRSGTRRDPPLRPTLLPRTDLRDRGAAQLAERPRDGKESRGDDRTISPDTRGAPWLRVSRRTADPSRPAHPGRERLPQTGASARAPLARL